MAFAASASSKEARSWSVGPVKMQLMTYSVASGDTSGTITAPALKEIYHVIVDGAAGVATAAPTFSGNVATLAFVNPAATRYGTILIIGR
jgi:hypothetical protein